MTHADLMTLIEYHYWARDRMLDAVSVLTPEQYTREMSNSFASIRDTLVHIYSAEWNWHQRWLKAPPVGMLNPADYPDVESLRVAWSNHEMQLRAFFAGMNDDDVPRVVSYFNLNGVKTSSQIGQMLQHVVNHATYHRGQIATLLRQLGAAPARSTDLIAFCRERQAG